MEKVLIKLARQLNAFDEASLMSLWDKYAAQVQGFEPTRRWEESTLIFGFLQVLRWKNQLFNYNWAAGAKPRENGPRAAPPAAFHDELFASLDPRAAGGPGASGVPGQQPGAAKGPTLQAVPGGLQDGAHGGSARKKRTKVLRFRPREGDETV